MADMTKEEREEILAFVERLEAWAGLVASGYEVPAAGQVMSDAARALRLLAERGEGGAEPVAWIVRWVDQRSPCHRVFSNEADALAWEARQPFQITSGSIDPLFLARSPSE